MLLRHSNPAFLIFFFCITVSSQLFKKLLHQSHFLGSRDFQASKSKQNRKDSVLFFLEFASFVSVLYLSTQHFGSFLPGFHHRFGPSVGPRGNHATAFRRIPASTSLSTSVRLRGQRASHAGSRAFYSRHNETNVQQ